MTANITEMNTLSSGGSPFLTLDKLKAATDRLQAQQEAQAREMVEAILAFPRRERSAAAAAFFDTFALHCAALAASLLPTALSAR